MTKQQFKILCRWCRTKEALLAEYNAAKQHPVGEHYISMLLNHHNISHLPWKG